MKKQHSKKWLGLFPFLAVIISFISFLPSAITALGDLFIEDDEKTFVYQQSSTLKYNVTPVGDALLTGEIPVSIGWALDPSAVPSTLTIPTSFNATTAEGTKAYTVVCLTKNAFSNCTFTTVKIPNTVREIKEQAFMGCLKMTAVTIPYQITEIKSSTFMDCRALAKVSYFDESGTATPENSTITTIADHAFASCISLPSFTFPSTLTEIGESAFQGCIKLVRALLPSTALTIRSYAFANCARMTLAHIPDETVVAIEPFAFADCISLTIYLMAESTDTVDAKYGKKYRKLRNDTADVADTDYIPCVCNYSSILVSEDHPDFLFAMTEGPIRITHSQAESVLASYTPQTNPDPSIFQESMRYATIIGYIGTTEANPDFVKDPVDKLWTLTIPERYWVSETESYPVSIIKTNAFLDHPEIQKVVFSANLVKIEEFAFNRCKGLTTLDFNNCEKLAEIGRYAFQNDTDYSSGTYRTKITKLELPACLKIIDGRAFCQLRLVTSLKFTTAADDSAGRKPQLIAIGRYAFYQCGYSAAAADKNKTDLVLPYSLSDAGLMKFAHYLKYPNSNFNNTAEGKAPDLNIDGTQECYAIATQVFKESFFLNSVRMADCPCVQKIANGETADHSTCNWTSFGSQAFYGSRIKYFISSSSLYRLHARCFANNINLKAVLLRGDRAYPTSNTTDCFGLSYGPTVAVESSGNYPKQVAWKNGLIAKCENAALYIDISEPRTKRNSIKQIFTRDMDKNTSNDGNTQGAYPDQYGNDTNSLTSLYSSRTDVPVYYDVNLDEVEAILDEDFHYFVPKGSDHIVVTNYVKNPSPTTVDFSAFSPIAKYSTYPVTEIGDAAFANNTGGRTIERLINLPNTIEKIGNRAFYSYENTANTFSQIEASHYAYKQISTVSAKDSRIPASCTDYLQLPTALKSIGEKAFINHHFKYITMDMGHSNPCVEFIGNAAFQTLMTMYMQPYNNSVLTGASVTFGSGCAFEYDNGAIYYNVNVGRDGVSSGNDEYYVVGNLEINNVAKTTIREGTTAILAEGMTGCTSTEVELPSSLKTIYGYGMAGGQFKTVSFSGTPQLKYLANRASYGSEAEVFDSTNTHVQNTVTNPSNASNYDRAYTHGAFRGCRQLVTMNLKSLSNMVALGKETFLRCEAFEEMTGNDWTYSYWKYTAGSGSLTFVTDMTKGVMDLSTWTSLKRVDNDSFKAILKLKYVHLPVRATSKTKASQVSYGTNLWGASNAVTGIFVGDIAQQALDRRGGSLSPASHYPANAFANGSSYFPTYFQASEASDIITDSGFSSVSYWCKGPTFTDGDSYIMFPSQADAVAFYNLSSAEQATLKAGISARY